MTSSKFPENSDTERVVEEPTKKKKFETPDFSELRDELISLAVRGEIKYTVNKIKKASPAELERIMVKNKQEQTDVAIEQVSITLIKQFSNLMDKLKMVDDGESMNDDFDNSNVLNKDLKKIVGYVTPYMPYIGIITGGFIVAGHVWSRKNEAEDFEAEHRPKEEEPQAD